MDNEKYDFQDVLKSYFSKLYSKTGDEEMVLFREACIIKSVMHKEKFKEMVERNKKPWQDENVKIIGESK